jgi:diguanylate cyclase (GGDEF)-like protein
MPDQRSKSLPGASRTEANAQRSRAGSAAARLSLVLLPAALAGCLGFAAVAYDMAGRHDQALATAYFERLRTVLAAEHGRLGRAGAVDRDAVTRIEQGARIPGLTFTSESAPERESQPVIDGQGRIAGFFTWPHPRPAMAALERLSPVIGGAVGLLFAGAVLLFWQLQRIRRRLSRAEREAAQAAETDKLTGLPNQAGTLVQLDRALAARRADEAVAFALVALDGVDHARLGMLGNDELMIELARRLKEALPADAICGRIAADEFAVIATAEQGADVETMLRAVLDALARPFWIDTAVRLSAHAGYARAPVHGATASALSRRAELALRSAGRRGPGTLSVFEPALDVVSEDRKFIQRELGRALTAHALDLQFQPIVSATGGVPVGVEALLRWTHPERGPIAPSLFVPIAEEMGLMDSLGAFVLRRALREAKRWPTLFVAVNLSPLQVRHPRIVELVREALAEAEVEPARLVLEITEGVLVDNPDEMVRRIHELHALGVRIALDDFGSGYSNLGYLQRFPLDKLKLDKSFVEALGSAGNGGVIVQAIAALGRALGLTVTVEGVETEQQRVLLRLAGCDEMQGYLFGKPGSAKMIDRLLAQRPPAPQAAQRA